ncbi:hypothetical protein S-PM2d226 [Synechococcus phage S-PM2]|uniref:Hypothetical-Protein / belonging to T4-LIKE GC: 741 n=1 Tax=Synechococcus phage S-PM2 TaxID=238854 RepID=Q5GQB1_BPSYP|nr:tail assembly chaperone [Synechococcus phage S-PM2]CAF34291.1 Hypothetical-Protein / belonging to T4-LIKE GC: 741 [Synechococcus phage S-PM2]CFW42463.1 hypothetical protein S-PM2d226 [Synechococcus phage S-PM2]
MTQTPIVRRPLLQMDLVNQYVAISRPGLADNQNIANSDRNLRKVEISDEMKQKFLETIGSFWHTPEDQLEVFSYYSDGKYFCQRQRQKYDFERDSVFWSDYSFTGASDQQANDLYNVALATFYVEQKRKVEFAIEKIQKVEKEITFFETKYLKRKREKKLLLNATDWRVLPDVEDNYPGEKDRWIAWRKKIRSIDVPNPENFDTMLDFAKSLFKMTYPIDPELYMDKYPEGLDENGNPAPEFMDPNDANQWVSYDDDASKDFVNDRVINAMIYAKQRDNKKVIVQQQIRDIIRDMKVEEIFPDFDSSLFVTEDD